MLCSHKLFASNTTAHSTAGCCQLISCRFASSVSPCYVHAELLLLLLHALLLPLPYSPAMLLHCLIPNAKRQLVQYRMPSGMRGGKSMHYEGGIRNFLAVQGPGVAAGCVDSTLLSLADVLPTVADLGGATDPTTHLLWDGSSFKNLLSVNATVQNSTGHKSAVPSQGSGYRGTSLASAEQLQRYVFILSEHCWDADAVPVLSANRYTRVRAGIRVQCHGVLGFRVSWGLGGLRDQT